MSTAATIVLDRWFLGADKHIGSGAGSADGRITLLLRTIRACIVAMGVRSSVCMAMLLCCTCLGVDSKQLQQAISLMVAQGCNLKYRLLDDSELKACQTGGCMEKLSNM